jgi:hypothetical protein
MIDRIDGPNTVLNARRLTWKVGGYDLAVTYPEAC